jgi:hypothetical protein
VGVNNRKTYDPRMQAEARFTLSRMETANISLINPTDDALGTDFDVWANTFANPAVAYFTGNAQVNVFRQTLNTFTPVGSITQMRSIRFTITDVNFPDGVRKGDRVIVNSCSTAPDLVNYQFTVTSAITSSHPLTHDIEAEADMAVTI